MTEQLDPYELDPYDWVIVHKDGSRHANTDALSRRPSLDNVCDVAYHAPARRTHAATQTCWDSNVTVCGVDFPPQDPVCPSADTTVNQPAHGLTPDPTPDQPLLYSLSHDGASIKEMQREDSDVW